MAENGAKKGWHERNGGNLSYRMKAQDVADMKAEFHFDEAWRPIGASVPNLAGEYFLVTGSGKYLANVPLAPEENIAIARIDESGENYQVVWGFTKGGQPTSEFPSHLMNHAVKKEVTGGVHRVIYHAHPANVIAITFVLPLEDKVFTRELWETMTECPVIFPDGVGVVPWMVPGGRDIAVATSKLMREYDVAIWAHHGLFCSGEDFDLTFGLMDAVEKAAEILVKVIAMGGKKQRITSQNFRDLAVDFHLNLPEKFLD